MSGIERILKLFRKKKYLATMGAGSISKMYKVSIEGIREARRIYKKEKFNSKHLI